MKKKLSAALIGILLIVVFFWLKGQSFIDVTVADSGASLSQYSYSLLNQKSQKVTEMKSISGHIKKWVPASSYEVMVSKDGSSYLAVVKTRGFFGKTSVGAELKPESARKFIGNNPGSCMDYLGSVLISYQCGELLSNAVIHEPATRVQPSYTQKKIYSNRDYEEAAPQGYLEGVISYEGEPANEALALVHSLALSEAGASQSIVTVNNELETSDQTNLPDLNTSTTYSIRPANTGFVIVNSSLSSVLYYATIKSKPVVTTLTGPQNTRLTPASLDYSDASILRLYSQPNDASAGKSQSELILDKDNRSTHYSLKQSYSSARFCGNTTVCAIGSKGMDVLDISGKKPALRFTVSGVTDIKLFGDKVIAVRKNGILDLDMSSRSGFVSYSFGNYALNSIQEDSAGYILNLSGHQGKFALLVDEKTASTDDIDKTMAKINTWPEVTAATAYGNYIFISPNLGPLEYVSQIHGFGYNPATSKVVNDKLDAELKTLNLDQKYTVVNLLK